MAEALDVPLFKRLSVAIKLDGRRQEDIAKAVGISRSGLGKYVRGVSEPTTSVAAALAKELGIDLVWLITGEGSIDPYVEVTDPAKPSLNRPTRLTAADVVDPIIFDDVTIGGMMRFADLMETVPRKSRGPQIAEKMWHVAMLEILIAHDTHKKMLAEEASKGDEAPDDAKTEKSDDRSD